MNGIFDTRRYLIPFRSNLLPQIFCDVLVVGSGVAGTRAALQAGAELGPTGSVIVLAKGAPSESNTAWAQGGIAGALASDDSVASHVEDTLTAGAGLCDDAAVRLVAEEGPAEIRRLVDWGMRFDLHADGTLDAGLEGGHTHNRVYHAGGDRTGAELSRVMLGRIEAQENVRLFDNCFMLDLVTAGAEPGAAVLGAITWHARFGLQVIWSRSTVLASGGAGQVYRETSNPRCATADGLAAAYRAGATLSDMAMVQFHPTTLYLPGAPRALISEAVRGEGAVLLDDAGRRFMEDEHALADLAPRDVVSRAIVRQLARQGGKHVWLDARALGAFGERFPGITRTLTNFGIDPRRDLIPVHPAAHYTIGGVRTDLTGRTGVRGLWAVGEASCTGLHGANRLASNSLLEGLVMGRIAGRAACDAARGAVGTPGPASIVSDIRPSDTGELDLVDVRSSLRSVMWKNVGVERAGPKLSDVEEMFDFWARYTLDKIFDEPDGWEVQNMLTVGALIARSASWRDESRGVHWRTDRAASEDRLLVHDGWRRGSGEPTLEPAGAAMPQERAPA